jgi:hypothetical protein
MKTVNVSWRNLCVDGGKTRPMWQCECSVSALGGGICRVCGTRAYEVNVNVTDIDDAPECVREAYLKSSEK